jgi:hypothetical protein
MSNKQLAVAAAAVGIVLAVIIVLLVTGGPPTNVIAQDPANDVQVSQGPAPPAEVSLADVRSARVFSEQGQVVFEAEMGSEIPKALDGQTMSWRWVILEAGTETWTVTADVSVVEPVARVLGQQVNYGASTIDDTLPGEVEREGNTIRIRLSAGEIDRFPRSFSWRLETTLDGDRRDPGSANATDTAPASGLGEFAPE